MTLATAVCLFRSNLKHVTLHLLFFLINFYHFNRSWCIFYLWSFLNVIKAHRGHKITPHVLTLACSFQLPCCSNLISARFTTSSFMLISIISSTGYRRSATAGWLSNTRCLVCRIARKMVPAQARCPPRNSSCYQPHFAVIAALYCFHALRARLQGNQLASSSKRGDLPGGSATWSP